MTDENLENGNQDLNEDVSENNQNTDFEIPEEYKERGWTKFFEGKTGDELKTELFKSYDNSQRLIGKKVESYLTQVDLKSLENYDDIAKAFNSQISSNVPETAEGYDFNDVLKNEDGTAEYQYANETLNLFGDKFKELGITKEQGQGLVKLYTDYEVAEFNKYTNADDLNNSINKMFNNNQEQRKMVEASLREFLSKEDQELLQKTAPNMTIEMFYKVAKGFVDKFAFKEGTANSKNPAQMRMSDADRDAEYNRLYNRLIELDSKPNQQVGEREEIVKAMQALFR